MSDQMIDVEQFRTEARAWLAENLERWPDPELIPSGGEDPAPEAVAEGRVIQRLACWRNRSTSTVVVVLMSSSLRARPAGTGARDAMRDLRAVPRPW